MVTILKRIYKKYQFLKYSPKQRANYLAKNGMKIGKGSEILDGVSFGSEPYLITIGENVKITKGVNFITHDGGV